METINIAPILQDAKKRLTLHPVDAAHDASHHARVADWSMKIVQAEGLNVDQPLLTVAGWLHDIEDRRGKKTKIIRQILRNNNCAEDFINRVIFIIGEHSFGKRQTAQESKILYDADKLEYVDPRRLNSFMQAAKDGRLDEKTYLKYQKQWAARAYTIPDSLHFNFSKKEFFRMLPAAKRIMRVK